MVQRFTADGLLRTAIFPDKVETAPNAVHTYRFEGTNLILEDAGAEVKGLPPCPSGPAIYQVQQLGRYRIKFVPIRDLCGPRRNTMNNVHDRIP